MRRPLLVGTLLLLPSLLPAQHRAPEVEPVPRPSPAPVAATARHPIPVPASASRPSPTPIPPASVHPGAVPRPVAPLRPPVNRPSTASPRQAIPSYSHMAPSPSPSDGSNSFDTFADPQVPGLGFDYVHFAATHPQQAHRRNPENSGNGVIIPLFGSGYYPSYAPVDEPVAQPPVEQSIESQYDQPPPMRRQPSTQFAEVPAPPVEHLPAPYPASESDEYVFVRRDGTVFFAVAYVWDLKTLRYITRQGLRQSISSDSLDLDATHQFNEQRGLTFRLPS